jgi:hypothetical protein
MAGNYEGIERMKKSVRTPKEARSVTPMKISRVAEFWPLARVKLLRQSQMSIQRAGY